MGRRFALDFIEEDGREEIIYTTNNVSLHDIANGVGCAINDFIETKHEHEHEAMKFVMKMRFVYNVVDALGLDYIAELIKQGFEDAGIDISGGIEK